MREKVANVIGGVGFLITVYVLFVDMGVWIPGVDRLWLQENWFATLYILPPISLTLILIAILRGDRYFWIVVGFVVLIVNVLAPGLRDL